MLDNIIVKLVVNMVKVKHINASLFYLYKMHNYNFLGLKIHFYIARKVFYAVLFYL